MKEKIYDEFSKPEWIKVDGEYYQRLKDNIEKYEIAIHEISIAGDLDEVEDIIKELNDELC